MNTSVSIKKAYRFALTTLRDSISTYIGIVILSFIGAVIFFGASSFLFIIGHSLASATKSLPVVYLVDIVTAMGIFSLFVVLFGHLEKRLLSLGFSKTESEPLPKISLGAFLKKRAPFYLKLIGVFFVIAFVAWHGFNISPFPKNVQGEASILAILAPLEYIIFEVPLLLIAAWLLCLRYVFSGYGALIGSSAKDPLPSIGTTLTITLPQVLLLLAPSLLLFVLGIFFSASLVTLYSNSVILLLLTFLVLWPLLNLMNISFYKQLVNT